MRRKDAKIEKNRKKRKRMVVKNLKKMIEKMISQKAMGVVEEFVQAIKKLDLKDSESIEVDFYDFAEAVGKMYLVTTNNEFGIFAEILGQVVCEKFDSKIKLKMSSQNENEIEINFKKDKDFNIVSIELDSLLGKIKKMKNGQLGNLLRLRNEEIVKIEDEQTIQYKVRSIFSEADKVRYNKFIAIRESGYKVGGMINDEDLEFTKLTQIMRSIMGEFKIKNVKDLIKFIGKAYEATNDEEFEMFVDMLNKTIIIGDTNRFKNFLFRYDESAEEFWQAANPIILGSLFVKIKRMKQNKKLPKANMVDYGRKGFKRNA